MSTGRDWDSWAGIGVTVHLRPDVTLASTIYAEENRAVLHVQGTNAADVALFATRADLDRLHAAVTTARDQLAADLAAIESATDGTDAAAADAA